MQYAEFIRQVQQHGPFASPEAALEATHSTLQVLAERLAGGEPNDLFAQLPRELVGGIHHRTRRDTENYGLDEFVRRVSAREGVDRETAVAHIRAVLTVLGAAVTPGEMQDVWAQLPREFAALVEPERGEARPGEE